MERDNSINVSFLSNTILQTRKNLGKTQEEFGNLFHPKANKGNISKWEKGKSIPSDERLDEISKLSGYSKEELLNGSLKYKIQSLISFALSYSADKYNSDLKKEMSYENKSFLRAASEINSLFLYDSFVRYPKGFRVKDFNNLTQKENEVLSNYFSQNIEEAEKYYLKLSLERAKGAGVSPKDRNILMFIIRDVVENHFAEYTPDNKGLLNLVRNSIEDIYADKIYKLIYVVNREHRSVRVAKNINPSLEKQINNILYDTEKKIDKLYKEFNIKD